MGKVGPGFLFLLLAACVGPVGDRPAARENRLPDYNMPMHPGAVQGCASDRTADWLHQNRPGGSDYDVTRCRTEGY